MSKDKAEAKPEIPALEFALETICNDIDHFQNKDSNFFQNLIRETGSTELNR